MICTGRAMIYMLGSPRVQLTAVLISGACELVQRSSIVVFDELLRERLFRAPMDAATRTRQIQIWTQVCGRSRCARAILHQLTNVPLIVQDICGTQLLELSTIPILGFLGPILRGAGLCDVFFLSESMPEDQLVVAVFASFLTEALVDLVSAYVERCQGIRTETW